MIRLSLPTVVAFSGLAALVACSANGPVPGGAGTVGGSTSSEGGTTGVGGSSNTGGTQSGGSGSGVAIGGKDGGTNETCASADYPAGRVPASLLFVFDRSSSMNEGVNGKGSTSKWDVATEAVSSALNGIDVQVDLGFNLFPAGKFDDSSLALCILPGADKAKCAAVAADNGCKDIDPNPAIPMSPIAESRPKIQSLLGKLKPTGGTPTLWALRYAYAYLKALPTAGERYVVLVTDGQPNTYTPASLSPLGETGIECGSLGDLAKAVSDATTGSPAIKTFVIGSPGDTDPDVLSGLALNGGTAKQGCTADNYTSMECHYQLDKSNFGDGLISALKEVAGKASNGCTYAVPAGANADPGFVNVAVSGPGGDTEILQDSTHASGWDYADEAKSKVEIFGETCEQLKNGGLATVKVLTGCKTKVAK